MRRAGKVALFAWLTALAACGGGGGGGGGASTPAVPPAPPAVTTQNVTFNIAIPQYDSAARRPRYVSPFTGWVTVTVTPAAGGTATTAANGCTSSSCTVTVAAPIGSDAFSLSLYDRQGGNLLSVGSTTYTVAANAASTVNVTFGGIATRLVQSGVPVMFRSGYAAQGQLQFQGFDADGNRIIGTASNPPTVTFTLPAHFTATAASSGVFPLVYTLAYDGTKVSGSLAFTASAPGMTPTTTTIVISTSILRVFQPPIAAADFFRKWNGAQLAVANGIIGYGSNVSANIVGVTIAPDGTQYGIGGAPYDATGGSAENSYVNGCKLGTSGGASYFAAGIAVDAQKNVYVSDGSGGPSSQVYVYPNSAFANCTTLVPTSAVSNAGGSLGIDGGANLYAFVGAGTIGVFPPGVGAPTRTIVPASGDVYSALGVNPAGDLAIVGTRNGTAAIFVVPQGQLVPSRVITGGATQLSSYAINVGIDPSDAVYTSVNDGSASAIDVLGFDATANGNVAPTSVYPVLGIFGYGALAVGPSP